MDESGDVDVSIVRLGFVELYIEALLLRCSMMLHTIGELITKLGDGPPNRVKNLSGPLGAITPLGKASRC